MAEELRNELDQVKFDRDRFREAIKGAIRNLVPHTESGPCRPCRVISDLGEVIFGEGKNASELEQVKADRDRLREGIDWLTQTLHRAHHSGTVSECAKNTCQYARQLLNG